MAAWLLRLWDTGWRVSFVRGQQSMVGIFNPSPLLKTKFAEH